METQSTLTKNGHSRSQKFNRQHPRQNHSKKLELQPQTRRKPHSFISYLLHQLALKREELAQNVNE
jgi:hypothetical protein